MSTENTIKSMPFAAMETFLVPPLIETCSINQLKTFLRVSPKQLQTTVIGNDFWNEMPPCTSSTLLQRLHEIEDVVYEKRLIDLVDTQLSNILSCTRKRVNNVNNKHSQKGIQ